MKQLNDFYLDYMASLLSVMFDNPASIENLRFDNAMSPTPIKKQVKIINYYYSVRGEKYWFVSEIEALLHLQTNHQDIFYSCINPEEYVQKDEYIMEYDL